MYYCDRHPVCGCENRRFLSTGMDFSKNVYAYVLKILCIEVHDKIEKKKIY